MNSKRSIIRVETPAGQRGFLGPDHTAYAVVTGSYAQTDPFLILMDDVLDKKDNQPVGGPHPHAGFETVSFLLEGEVGDAAHTMKAGDLQLMTAGRGVVHTETIDKAARMRLLQLWLNLPKKDRQATPRVQDLALQHVPVHRQQGLEIRVYSGSFAGQTSPTLNYTPLILADIHLEAGAATQQQLSGHYNAFLYVLEGSVKAGADNTELRQGQVAWLDRPGTEEQTVLELTAGPAGSRLVLYAGEPQHEPIVSHGPFIADTEQDIMRLYKDYREGKMKHISEAADEQRIQH